MIGDIKQGVNQFPHDTNAASDNKIEALRSIYGNDGYAFYFILLEQIYRTDIGEIFIENSIVKNILSKKCGIEQDRFEEMLLFSMEQGCFDKQAYLERGVLTSDGIKKRIAAAIKRKSPPSPKPPIDAFVTAQHLSMTRGEYDKLCYLYGEERVKDKIEWAKNYSPLKNYLSLYLTLNNWLRSDNERGKPAKSIYKDMSNYVP